MSCDVRPMQVKLEAHRLQLQVQAGSRLGCRALILMLLVILECPSFSKQGRRSRSKQL